MDSRRFDALAESLSRTDTRHRFVRLLAVLPLGLTLTSVLGDGPDATAKKHKQHETDDDHGSSHRRHRRKTRNARRSGDAKDNRKGKRKRKRTNDQPYCHSIEPRGRLGKCPTGNTQFCLSVPINGGDSTHARAACEACFGPDQCVDSPACGGVFRTLPISLEHMFAYGRNGAAGKILIPYNCKDSAARWAP